MVEILLRFGYAVQINDGRVVINDPLDIDGYSVYCEIENDDPIEVLKNLATEAVDHLGLK